MKILFSILLLLIIADTIMKLVASKRGYDINFIIEVLVEKIGWFGYCICLIALVGIIILINSIILTLIAIAAYVYIAAKQVTQFKPEESELSPDEIK